MSQTPARRGPDGECTEEKISTVYLSEDDLVVSREHFGPLESVVRVVWVVGVMGDEDVEAGRVGAQGEVGGLGCMIGGNSGQVHHVLTCMAPERDDDQRLVVTAGKLPVPKNWGVWGPCLGHAF